MSGASSVVKELPLADAYARMRPSLYGAFLLALCVAIGMVEGYDVQAMALAAPMLARQWQLDHGAIGLLLSISLIGQVVGGFLLAPLGDRFGRRPIVLAGLCIAGSATLAGAFIASYPPMMLARFIAGLGLGMALANTIALAMELVPNNWRSIAVVFVCCGYPLGSATGAAVVGTLIPIHGVAAIFYVGGFSTLAALLVGLIALPESPVMLLRRKEDQAGLKRLMARLGVVLDPVVQLVGHSSGASRSTIAALFTPDRRTATLLLWVLNFANLSLVYFFIMWLPSLFVSLGLAPQDAVRATSLFSSAGIAGGLISAMLLPRIGPIATLGSCYALMIAAVATFASLSGPGPLFYFLVPACGFLIIGSQFGLSAVVSLFYPGPIRTTGSGFALGMGRLGGVFAPIVGGAVLAYVSAPQNAFYVALIPAVICLLALLALRRLDVAGARSE